MTTKPTKPIGPWQLFFIIVAANLIADQVWTWWR